MFARWPAPMRRRRARAADAKFDLPWDDFLCDGRPWPVGQRADCCVALAAYRVVLPAGPSSAPRSELFLCRHHLHATAVGRERCRAVVYDMQGRLVASPPEEAPRPVGAVQSV